MLPIYLFLLVSFFSNSLLILYFLKILPETSTIISNSTTFFSLFLLLFFALCYEPLRSAPCSNTIYCLTKFFTSPCSLILLSSKLSYFHFHIAISAPLCPLSPLAPSSRPILSLFPRHCELHVGRPCLLPVSNGFRIANEAQTGKKMKAKIVFDGEWPFSGWLASRLADQ